MGFWRNVDDFLKYKVITRKELASGIGMQTQTIDRAIQRDSEPKLTDGLKVCKFLNITIDELLNTPITLNENNQRIVESESNRNNEIKLFRKYNKLISNC